MRILLLSNTFSSTFFKRLPYSKKITTYICDSENYNVNNLSNKDLRKYLYISKKKYNN